MNIVSPLQRKVNKVVTDATSDSRCFTSFNDMADVGILSPEPVSTADLIDSILEYLCLLDIRGLCRYEHEIPIYITAVLWCLYAKWLQRHLYRDRMSGILREVGMNEQADNFDRCGEHVYNLECCQCRYVHPVRYHCKTRLCPECGRVRKTELTYAYSDALRSLGRLRFVTLTIKNVSVLKDGVDKIRSCFTKLRHRKYDKNKYYKNLIVGGLYGIECPVGNDGLWNVHLHFVYAGEWIEQRKLSDDWEKITGDSRVVFIQDVKHGRSPIGYILKYVNKHDSVVHANDGLVGEYVVALANVRLLQPFGKLLGMKADKGLFLCPCCNECIWRVISVGSGKVIFDELENLRARGTPFSVDDLVGRG